jgi:RHS repeat-associated protein
VRYAFDAGAGTQERLVDYVYDAVGNRTSVTDNAVVTPYTSNNVNQYTAIDSLVPPQYDSNGNVTAMQTKLGEPIWSFSYDAQNRLISGSNTAGTTFAFAYDAKNRCVARTINGTTTAYVFDDWNLIEERSATGALTAKYIHGAAIDELLVRTTAGGSVYYHHDGLGSTTALTNSTGAVVESCRYDIFGESEIRDATGTLLPGSATGNRFQFTGREHLPEIGLHDYRNRIYSTTLGRFLQIDPIRFDAGDVNLYRYVGNAPTTLADPLGLYNVDKCKIEILLGHGKCMPKSIANHPCSASSVVACQAHRTKVERQIPGTSPNMRDCSILQGDTKANADFEKGKEYAEALCNDEAKCCKKVTVEIICKFGVDLASLMAVPAGTCGKKYVKQCN